MGSQFACSVWIVWRCVYIPPPFFSLLLFLPSPSSLISNQCRHLSGLASRTHPPGSPSSLEDTKTALNLQLCLQQHYSCAHIKLRCSPDPQLGDSVALALAGLAFSLIAHPTTHLLFP